MRAMHSFHHCTNNSSYVRFIALLNDCTSTNSITIKFYDEKLQSNVHIIIKICCDFVYSHILISLESMSFQIVKKNTHHEYNFVALICILNWAKIFNSIEPSHALKISPIIILSRARLKLNWSAIFLTHFSLLLLLSISIVF